MTSLFTNRFTLHPSTSLARVASHLPFTYTGADFYALCSDAMLKAVTRQASAVDAKIAALPDGPVSTAYYFDHYATKDDVAVMVTEEDFLAAMRELVPSVSAKELEHYGRVRKMFEAVGEGENGANGTAQIKGKGKAGPAPEIEWRAEVPTRPSSARSGSGRSGSDRWATANRDRKGKGKAVAVADDPDYDDRGDDIYAAGKYGNGNTGAIGKGKDRVSPLEVGGFHDGDMGDEDGMYE